MGFNLRQIPKKQWLVGCSVAVFGFVGTFALLFFLAVQDFRQNFLKDSPDQIPVATYNATEVSLLRNRVDTFINAVREGEETAEITITRDELNKLIASQPEMADQQGRIYIKSITPDEIIVTLNLPLESMDIPEERLQGKYLTGDMHLVAGMHQGAPRLYFIKLAKDGKEAPQQLTPALAQIMSLQAWRENDDRVNAVANRTRELELLDDQIRVVVAPGPSTMTWNKDD